MTRRYVAGALLAVGSIAAAGGMWRLNRNDGIEVSTAKVTTGPIVWRVVTTGTLRALTTVDIGTEVSGTISSLAVDFNSVVRAHQVLARLDPADYEASLDEARATLTQAQAELSGFLTSDADARTRLSRAEDLAARQLIPGADLEAARVTLEQAEADVLAGNSRVQQAKTGVEQATLNLERTVIRSPIDGVVLERHVDVGQTVAATLASPVLFRVASDFKRMQLAAELDQSEVPAARPGQRVTFTVEAYPTKMFSGTVSEIRLQPLALDSSAGGGAPTTGAASSAAPAPGSASGLGTVTYIAIVDVANPEERLRPGMTATVSLEGERLDNVTRIPNAALTFRPGRDVLQAIGEADVPMIVKHGGDDEPGRDAEVWEFDGDLFHPVPVRLGFGDSDDTQLLSGSLNDGDSLVTRAAVRKPSPTRTP